MNDTARRLRAMIPFSTDPDWLERMAREAEANGGGARPGDASAADGQLALDLPPRKHA